MFSFLVVELGCVWIQCNQMRKLRLIVRFALEARLVARNKDFGKRKVSDWIGGFPASYKWPEKKVCAGEGKTVWSLYRCKDFEASLEVGTVSVLQE